MSMFRSPKRRLTRQKSGYKVGGVTTGSDCKIRCSKLIEIDSQSTEFKFSRNSVELFPLFKRNLGIVAFSSYFYPKNRIEINGFFSYTYNGEINNTEFYRKFEPDKWSKFGFHKIIKIINENYFTQNLSCNFKIASKNENVGIIDLFGIYLDSVSFNVFRENDFYDLFQTKTSIYLPEIYYFALDQSSEIFPDNIEQKRFKNGRPVVLKSCNRCSRFLLVDVEHERNTLSFSNHCTSRAPCRHNAFSTYTVLENECDKLPGFIRDKAIIKNKGQRTIFDAKAENIKIHMHYGYQLECKSCKKFFVNAPLNPKRNSTQHREDSLRRRAIEVLVDTLLEKEWIYHKYRVKKGREFDRYIWEKFERKCFKCKRELPRCEDMDLDHTMPLSYLWPLDDTATCLCPICNSLKHDKFPIDFYTKEELEKLVMMTGLDENIIKSRQINKIALDKLLVKIDWFFDEFLMSGNYQKIRGNKKTADLIYYALQNVIAASGLDIDLLEEYNRKNGKYPISITI